MRLFHFLFLFFLCTLFLASIQCCIYSTCNDHFISICYLWNYNCLVIGCGRSRHITLFRNVCLYIMFRKIKIQYNTIIRSLNYCTLNTTSSCALFILQRYQIVGETRIYMAMSADATCRGLDSARDGPLVMELTRGNPKHPSSQTCMHHYICIMHAMTWAPLAHTVL